jgi:hypothetical protein
MRHSLPDMQAPIFGSGSRFFCFLRMSVTVREYPSPVPGLATSCAVQPSQEVGLTSNEFYGFLQIPWNEGALENEG